MSTAVRQTPAYLDTNALLSWARSRTGTCTLTDSSTAGFVENLLTSQGTLVALSEITLIEFYDNITHWFRKGDTGADEAWHKNVDADLMQYLSGGLIEVLAPEDKLYEKAMRYVRMAAIPDKRKFRAMDAAHLVQAVGWSRRRSGKVDLISADGDFRRLVSEFTAFQKFVTIVDPITGQDVTPR